ncbi:MAG TPA: carboxypeptidase-like regulatory domain-containing protein, partial [Pyrinomonadaceae bacterium]|nr:carboxypeptidase-like regulatory domain-containing protein [Pyrinomonadaceae bacterium]
MRVLVILLLICLPCFGQTSGTLDVIVKDPSGALVHKAQVQLVKDGRVQSTAQTNEKGEVRFSKLSFGNYEIRVEAAGFKTQNLTDLNVSTHLRKEVSLEIDVIKV